MSEDGLPPEDEILPVPDFPAPEQPPELAEIGMWFPRLNPTQQEEFDSLAKYILTYGEKGSGKSIGGLSALVRHCYEEEEALALIIAPQIRTGKEGVIYDLEWILDIWKNGNIDPTDKDRRLRLDVGMGLDYTAPKLDPQTKDRVIFIGNRHGGWSKVILMSIPYAEVVEKRMKSLSPSFVYVDEITELDSKEFFVYVAQQLGRRRGIKGPQQYVASCNPEGPSHWVYQVWWIDCIDAETGQRDPDYAVFHVPIAENYDNLPPGYIEGLKKLYRDETDRKRLLDGEWVDRPSGDAIFRSYFKPEIHVRGDRLLGKFLTPRPGIPIIVNYDPGPRNYCIAFQQMIPTKERTIWTVVDEINFVGEFAADEVIAKKLVERMAYWDGWLKDKHKTEAKYVHIGPEDAFTHMRSHGDYDSERMKKLTKQFSNGKYVVRMRKCPAPANSVPQRVRMMIGMFLSDEFFISAMAPKTAEAFKLLTSEKAKPGKADTFDGLRPQRSPYLHPFDAASYGPYYFTLHPSMVVLQTSSAQAGGPNAGSGVYRAGRG